MATAVFSSEGKIFLITGAATGLGAGFAERFLKDGAKHIAILDVAVAAGVATADNLNRKFGAKSVSFIKCDVTDEAVLNESFNAVVAQQGRIDVVINNAGIMDDSAKAFRKANDVNWQALVTLTMLARQHMRTDRGGAGGTVANISSVAALVQWPYLPIYSGAKAAVLLFGSCLGLEEHYSKTEVRILTMCFGPTKTPLMEGLENRSIDEEVGKNFDKTDKEMGQRHQKVEAAVEGMARMVEQGASGSTWLAHADKPPRDISQVIKAGYDSFLQVMLE